MLFRRREAESLLARLRTAVWPRSSWSRSTRYFLKRILRLSGSPHVIAAGVAAGVFASFTPFVGFHFILSFILAYVIGGNMLAAALGTFFGNPLTFPFIWASTYGLGIRILGHHPGRGMWEFHHNLAEKSLDALWPLFAPMSVGAVVLGLPVAMLFYVGSFFAVRAFRDMRRERLDARRRERSEEMAADIKELDEA